MTTHTVPQKRYTWKRRAAMIERGKRLLIAHWRNRCEASDLDRWFDRHFRRYVVCHVGNVRPTNLDRMRAAFWRDVSKAVRS